MGHLDTMGVFLACLLLGLAATPVIAVLYAGRMNERLATALAQVGEISRDNARLYQERRAIVGERDEALIRLDEARQLAARQNAPKEPS